VAIRYVLVAKNSPECVCDRGSAPDPAEGAYDAPPDPVVGWGGGYPHTPGRLGRFWTAPSAPLCPGTNYEKSAPMAETSLLQK